MSEQAQLPGAVDSAAPGRRLRIGRRSIVLDDRSARTAPRTLQSLAASSALLAAHLAPASPRDTARRRLLACADAVAFALAGAFAIAVAGPADGSLAAWLPFALMLPGWVVLNKLLGLYDRDAHVIHKSTLDELPKLLQSIGLGLGVMVLLAPLAHVGAGRPHAVAFGLAAALLLPAGRGLARGVIRHSFAPERCLVVGSGSVAALVARKVRSHPEHGVALLGFVDQERYEPSSEEDDALHRLGDLGDFETVCREHGVERVLIAFSSISHEQLLDVIRASKLLGLKITVVPRLFEMLGHAVEVDQVQGMTLLGLRGLGRTRSSLMVKRAIDVAGAALGLVFLAPPLLAIALAIKITSPGPVFFGQQRMGRRNQPFTMWKFRTMVRDAEAMKDELRALNEADGPMFKIARDPRVTPVGRFLRATSLDELPQLWNVLRGDMSLVGPRPLVPDENEHLIGWHRARLELTPGLTGPWQVLGRSAIPFTEMVKLDYHYVADWSLWNDLKLLIRTVPVVIGRRGV